MEEKQVALWEQVQKEGTKLNKDFCSLHISEDRYMLNGREVAVLFEIGHYDLGPCDCYYVDELLDIRNMFLYYKDKDL